MHPVKAYAAYDAETPLRRYDFDRRELGPKDVLIDIRYCGVCHSDLHFAKNDLEDSVYPLVPGHEIVGEVAAVGANVTRHKAGDRVGVGVMVNSCGHCHECKAGEEQFCRDSIGTYNADDRDGTRTQGGYSTRVVVDEHFVLKIPDALPLDAIAPLLCAGITTWSPLKTWNAGPGTRLGVIGLGGLGHMAVKLGAALGCHVTVVSTSDRKKADAERFGAHDFLVSTDVAAMKASRERFDLILNTVSSPHEIDKQLRMLARDGTMVMLGLTNDPVPVDILRLMDRRRRLASSPIGGIRETQEMLDFCAKHAIAADIETIRMDEINQAYERMQKSDVRYRFVIDMASLA
ncbi:MAG TPA: NAD(P)-dependent alcohol dehydrogenase [Caulobacteraceae bacterium]|jgi:uncharacterized zinc-type alcohol dehydrogenase-like protein|nr:NAD(P)-dependent alcohol dehydrogenase [Caulobacteraceae bacterium]